jgi:hypothetical protein
MEVIKKRPIRGPAAAGRANPQLNPYVEITDQFSRALTDAGRKCPSSRARALF